MTDKVKTTVALLLAVCAMMFAFIKKYDTFDPVVIHNPDSATTEISGMITPGDYKYELRVMDNDSVWSEPDTVTVHVLPGLLPSKFISVRGEPDNGANKITWLVDESSDCRSYYIMASNNGSNFVRVDSTYCRHQYLTRYEYYHYSPPRICYYKIIQVDQDGVKTNSQVVMVVHEVSNKIRYVNNKLIVETVADGDAVMEVLASDGRRILSTKVKLIAGNNLMDTQLPRGILFVRVTMKQYAFIQKIFVQ